MGCQIYVLKANKYEAGAISSLGMSHILRILAERQYEVLQIHSCNESCHCCKAMPGWQAHTCVGAVEIAYAFGR